LAVIHDEIRIAQLAGGAEIEHLAVDPAVEHHGRIAERAKGHRHGNAADHVVDDFMPHHDLQGIGAYVVAHAESNDRLDIGQFDFVDGGEGGVVDGGNPVLGRPAREDIVEIDRGDGEVGLGPLILPAFARRRPGVRWVKAAEQQHENECQSREGHGKLGYGCPSRYSVRTGQHKQFKPA
jgi:hypothetical protein